MDVTCDRCGTDYEFEETLVSTRGTTVKCTQCGHLFKVYKPASPLDAASPDKHPWTVRRVDGSIHRLASLADLTRLIGEAAFSREDEVSRTGKAWKKLGDIDELRGFFRDRVREQRDTPRDIPRDSDAPPIPRTRRNTYGPELGLRASHSPSDPAPLPRGVSSLPPPVRSLPPSAAPAAQPPAAPPASSSSKPAPQAASASQPSAAPSNAASASGGPAARFDTMGGQVELDARGVVRGVEQVKSTRPAASAERAAVDLDAATTSRRRAVSSEIATPIPAAAEARNEQRRRTDRSRSFAWLWATLILLGSGAAATYLLWPMLQERLRQPPPQDPTAEFVARADAAFATHRIQHFEDAATEYVKALAFHESDPHILSSLSRVYAVWSQETRFKKRALEQVHQKNDVEQRSELVTLEREERQLAEQAKRYGESAARKNPGNEEAEIALSDALRLNGNLVAARSELDRARSTQTVPTGETLRVAALLAIDEASGDMRAGTKLASLAVAQEPELIRARLLLARCLLADRDTVGARYQLSAVETRDRSHPGVLAVQQELERAEAPEPVPSTTPDAGVAAASGDTQLPVRNAPPEDLTHDGFVLRGQSLLERGEVNDAKRMFEQALFTKPSSGAAHTGLGYVALEKGRPQLAVEHFQPAARAGNLEALIGLGDAYRRLRRPRDALKSYQKYLSREPNGARSNIARAQIERLTDEISGSP